MADTTSRTSIIVAVITLIGVLGAAVIGNWDRLFPPTPPVAPTQTATGTTPASHVPKPEIEVPAATNDPKCGQPFNRIIPIPGDTIFDFHVVNSQADALTIDVDYRYDSSHQSVILGAWLHGDVTGGYQPTPLTSQIGGKGTGRIAMTIEGKGKSSYLQLFLYEALRPAEPFACRFFPYVISRN
jgi:hypothetical protein